jgi:Protein of unknown function (DUF3775)
MATLSISPEKVCYVIVKAREYDVQVPPDDPDSGSNPADDKVIDVLESSDNPAYEELLGALQPLNEDETLDLVALTWIGRGTYGKDDWLEARDQAGEIPAKDRPRYLIRTPLLGDFLEQGLDELGYSCEDYEIGRL